MDDEALRREVEARFEREARELASGPNRARPDLPYVVRKGSFSHQPTVFVDGRELKVKLPRLSWVGELPKGQPRYFAPPHYAFLQRQREHELQTFAVEAMMEGVSTRGAKRFVERTRPGESTRGMSKSSVARRFKKASEVAVEHVTERPLDHIDLAAVMFDGIEVGGETVVVALGFDRDGEKHLLGMANGASESKELVVGLLENLERRGAQLANRLMITDGGGGLEAGLAAKGYDKAVQRCIRHVQANVREHMTHRLEFDGVEARLAEAGRGRNRRKGLPRLRKLANELGGLGHERAAKLLSEWVEAAAKERRRAGARRAEQPQMPREKLEEIRAQLPTELWEGVRRPLQRAWMSRDFDRALTRLQEVETRLHEIGERKAAKSLRDSMLGTLTVTRLGVSSAEIRKALLSTNPLESLNGRIRAALRKHTPAWRQALAGDEIPMQTRWAAIAALRASGSWTRIENAEELAGLSEAIATDEALRAAIEPRPLDRFDAYVEVLGPRTRELVVDLDSLSESFAGAGEAVRAAARPVADPFAKLDAVIEQARERQLHHAAARVATAEYMHEHPGRRIAGTALLPAPDKMLDLYAREWGAEAAAEVAATAAKLADEFRREVSERASLPEPDAGERAARWAALEVSQRRRIYQYPYPPPELLEQELDRWLAENGLEARAAVALERAEQRSLARGAGTPSLNQTDMASKADNPRSQSTPTPADRGPRHEARRFVVASAKGESRHPSEIASPADGSRGWRWLGDEETLGRFGVAPGAEAAASPYLRAASGQHTETEARLRTANTVAAGIDGGGSGPSHVQGLVQLSGSYRAPDEVAAAWRQGGQREREAVERWMLDEAQRGIAHLAGTERYAAAASVRELRGEDGPALKVDWVAIGAEREKGVASAYDRKRMASLGRFNKEAQARPVQLPEPERTAGVETPEPRPAPEGPASERPAPQRPASERPAPQRPASERQAPQRPASERQVPEKPARPAPELPSRPLRDSLTTHLGAYPEVAGRVKEWADRAGEKLPADLSESELRRYLPPRDPFKHMPKEGRQALNNWWVAKGGDVVRTVAIEERLIGNAREAYSALAERESARLGSEKTNPLGEIRAQCGEQYAEEVDRQAAVMASGFGQARKDPNGNLTKALDEAIERAGGYDKARFEHVVKRVALQNNANMHSERELQRQQRAAVRGLGTAGTASEVAAGL